MDLSALMEPQPPLPQQQHQPAGSFRHTPSSSSSGSSGGRRGRSRGGDSSGRGSSGRGEQRSSSLQRLQPRSQSQSQSQQRQQQSADEDTPTEVDRLCVQANRALVGRACTLVLVYYLPTFILYGWLAYFRVRHRRASLCVRILPWCIPTTKN